MIFSVIIPCYNLETWIRESINSVLLQSFADWECIVIDDGSTDCSCVILDEYAKRDWRIKVIHQKNAGEGGARNAGLAIAQGEWVFFLDGDDVMAPGVLERLSRIIDQYPNEDLIRFGFEKFDDGEDLKCVEKRCVCKQSGLERVVDISRQIKFDDYFVYVWQFIFRRTMVAGMKFDHYERGADRTFIVSVLCNAVNSFVAFDDICYFYRRRRSSAVHSSASVRMMKDELSHRVDVMTVFDQCGKTVSYNGEYWLEGYCLRGYLTAVESCGDYSRSERKELVKWFYHELSRMSCVRGYSIGGRVSLVLYKILRGKIGRYFVRKGIPCVFHRLKTASMTSALNII